jgi:hypothetical protein
VLETKSLQHVVSLALRDSTIRDTPDSLKSLPIRPGVPTAIPTFVLWRYSTCSANLKCFANSLATSVSLPLNSLTSLNPQWRSQRAEEE